MERAVPTSTHPNRRARRIAALLGGLAAVLCLEAVLRLCVRPFPPEDPFFTFVNDRPAFVEELTAGGESYYRCRRPCMLDVRFPAEKSPGELRIFCLGGSAAMGWPHPPQLSFPACLERLLTRAYPARRFRVINAAGNTFASYRVRLLVPQILKLGADLIVVYSGNNEFLERRIYRRGAATSRGVLRLRGWLERLRSFQLLRSLLSGIFRRWRLQQRGAQLEADAYTTGDVVQSRHSLLLGKPTFLRTDPEQFRAVREHYEHNIRSIVRLARDAGVAVILCTVPVNLRDWRPNVSTHRRAMSAAAREEWERLVGEARRRRARGELAAALESLAAAEQLDDGWAELHYERGRILYEQGRYASAAKAFRRALVLDGFPFRALPAFNRTIRNLGAALQAPVADLEQRVRAASEHGIPGLDLFVDYVHPRVETNQLLAAEVVRTMVRAGMLPRPQQELDDLREPVDPRRSRSPWVLRSLLSQYLIMHQYEGAESLAAEFLQSAGEQLARLTGPRRSALKKEISFVQRLHRALRRLKALERARGEDSPPGDLEERIAAAVHRIDTLVLQREKAHVQLAWGGGRSDPRLAAPTGAAPRPAPAGPLQNPHFVRSERH
jgi:tetratricopeptide (TPR) repeat protein